MLLEENKLPKLQRFSFENLCEKKNNFVVLLVLIQILLCVCLTLKTQETGHFQVFVRGKVHKFRGS